MHVQKLCGLPERSPFNLPDQISLTITEARWMNSHHSYSRRVGSLIFVSYLGNEKQKREETKPNMFILNKL